MIVVITIAKDVGAPLDITVVPQMSNENGRYGSGVFFANLAFSAQGHGPYPLCGITK
jgi:hypothetical protein